MKITAKTSIEVNGFGIVCRGKSIDIDPAKITKRIAKYFTAEDGTELSESEGAEKVVTSPEETVKDKIAITVKVMKREGIIQALEGMGITFSPNSKTDYLAKLLLINKGEIEA